MLFPGEKARECTLPISGSFMMGGGQGFARVQLPCSFGIVTAASVRCTIRLGNDGGLKMERGTGRSRTVVQQESKDSNAVEKGPKLKVIAEELDILN